MHYDTHETLERLGREIANGWIYGMVGFAPSDLSVLPTQEDLEWANLIGGRMLGRELTDQDRATIRDHMIERFAEVAA